MFGFENKKQAQLVEELRRINELNKRIAEYETNFILLNAEITNLREVLIDKDLLMAELKKEKLSLEKKQQTENSNSKDDFKKQSERLASELKAAKDTLAVLKKEKEQFEVKLNTASKDFEQVKKQQTESSNTKDDSKKKLEKLTLEFKTTQDSLVVLKKEKEQFEVKLNQATKELDQEKKQQGDTSKLKDDFKKQSEKLVLELKSATDGLAALKKEKGEIEVKLNQATKELDQEKKQQSESSNSKDDIKKQSEKLSLELKSTKDSLATLTKEKEQFEVKLKQASKDLEQEKKQQAEASKSKDDLKKQVEKLTLELKSAKDGLAALKKEKEQFEVKLNQATKDSEKFKRQNKLLLSSIDHVETQLSELGNLNRKQVESSASTSAKLARLIARTPELTDFGDIEISELDVTSDIPKIAWRVRGYSSSTFNAPEFFFRTVLQDGLSGIAIVESVEKSSDGGNLIPKLLKTSASDVEAFRRVSAFDWEKILAATHVLEQVINSQGKNIAGAESFDFAFWQNSLTSLVVDIRKLPSLLRFNRVKLKRELLNPDYEHLWLEIFDLEFGSHRLPKLELRIGASMVTRDGFSKFPKLEIPLIDGRDKPFESWFAESRDDFGAKFELRFALEKNVFDYATFSKLNPMDQRLVGELISAMPFILDRMIGDQISIHRPWETWRAFAVNSDSIFKRMISEVAKTSANVVPEPKPPAQKETVSNKPVVSTRGSAAPSKIVKSISVSVVKSSKSLPAKSGTKSVVKVTKSIPRKVGEKTVAKASKPVPRKVVTKTAVKTAKSLPVKKGAKTVAKTVAKTSKSAPLKSSKKTASKK